MSILAYIKLAQRIFYILLDTKLTKHGQFGYRFKIAGTFSWLNKIE